MRTFGSYVRAGKKGWSMRSSFYLAQRHHTENYAPTWHPPHATHWHVIEDLTCFTAPMLQRSEYSHLSPGRHPQPWLTATWPDASVGRQELLVQCPRPHYRSIPPYVIRGAETDVLTDFSTLPTLSTTMLQHMHARTLVKTGSIGNLPVLPPAIQADSSLSIFIV